MSYVDITFLEPTDLAEMGGIGVEDAEAIIQFAEEAAERIENQKPEDVAAEEGRTVAAHLADPNAVVSEAVAAAPLDGEVPAESPPMETNGEISHDEVPVEEEMAANGEVSHGEVPAEETPANGEIGHGEAAGEPVAVGANGEISENGLPEPTEDAAHHVTSEESPPQS